MIPKDGKDGKGGEKEGQRKWEGRVGREGREGKIEEEMEGKSTGNTPDLWPCSSRQKKSCRRPCRSLVLLVHVYNRVVSDDTNIFTNFMGLF
jgi:hypothetical protein